MFKNICTIALSIVLSLFAILFVSNSSASPTVVEYKDIPQNITMLIGPELKAYYNFSDGGGEFHCEFDYVYGTCLDWECCHTTWQTNWSICRDEFQECRAQCDEWYEFGSPLHIICINEVCVVNLDRCNDCNDAELDECLGWFD
jgi:hypothetical protein